MILLVGLGNPGSEYAETRHNIGFMAVDVIVRRYSFSPFKSKFKGEYAEGVIAGEKVMILKPQTYMNLSGEAVRALCQFYKIPVENIVVFHDDMDLPVGKVKVKTGGGSGGHNGIKSIDAHLGNSYMRVRIGVSKPATGEQVVNWVLSGFPKADKDILAEELEKMADFIPLLLQKNESQFMNKLALTSNIKK